LKTKARVKFTYIFLLLILYTTPAVTIPGFTLWRLLQVKLLSLDFIHLQYLIMPERVLLASSLY